ncbi:ATP-dependent Zn protease [Marinibactrum halimedae]|uniref:ATP-dependent Zn protease n=2 Tax=Marinibactrum halimedae TaxID=1444977 RepID=A0AA37T8Z3_9GAMM|nr:ATP-dependent Zn protease [Marinibactrum halimedae]
MPVGSTVALDTTLINSRLDQQAGQLAAISTQLAVLSQTVTELKASPSKPNQSQPPSTIAPVTQANSGNTEPTKTIVGEVEWIWLQSIHMSLSARIDTGASLSSMNATDLNIYEKDGQRWARFKVTAAKNDADVIKGQDGELIVDTPVIRFTRIRKPDTQDTERRAVVKLPIRLGNLQQLTEFTLSNRKDMDYPIVIGRNFLQDLAIVDVSKKYVQPRHQLTESAGTPLFLGRATKAM